MSADNLPAVRDEQPREIARADTDSWIEVVGEVAKFAGYIAGTEFVPRSLRDSPAAATAAIMYGREVGLPPMTALTQTHVIEGRPSLSAEGMRALVLAAGHDIEVLESTGAICRMRARRRGSERWSPEVVWTIDMARAAGLLSKNNWKNYPRQMLSARCSAELCTLHFPDVTLGFRSIEDLEDLGGEETASTTVQPQAGTKVQRARKTAKSTPAALPAAPPAKPEPVAGPPLPGEPGFDQDDTDKSGGAPDDGPAAAVADAGEHFEGAPSDAQDAELVDVSDAELVDEEPPTEGNQGKPTTRRSAPRATSTSSTSGRAPDAGSSTHRENPAAAQETRPAVAAGPDEPPAEPDEPLPDPGPRMASRGQMRMLMAQLGDLGVAADDREERLLIGSQIVGRALGSFTELTNEDAKKLIDTLGRCRTREHLMTLLDELEGGQA